MDAWSESLELGDPTADAAHRELHELTRAADDAMRRSGQAALAAALRGLFSGSLAHFEQEEAQMVESAYPGLLSHREAHATFMAEFRRVNAELERNGISPLFRLWFGSRFVDWLRFHLKGADAQFYRHWRDHQATKAAAGPGPAGAPPGPPRPA